mmetsp:Transcript_70936/g.178878  ORF Transcript_70936/g.178878 Transcript_70936/m.178878 type:complete len:280 (-) Transcript_70936:1807-2646(-)
MGRSQAVRVQGDAGALDKLDAPHGLVHALAHVHWLGVPRLDGQQAICCVHNDAVWAVEFEPADELLLLPVREPHEVRQRRGGLPGLRPDPRAHAAEQRLDGIFEESLELRFEREPAQEREREHALMGSTILHSLHAGQRNLLPLPRDGQLQELRQRPPRRRLVLELILDELPLFLILCRGVDHPPLQDGPEGRLDLDGRVVELALLEHCQQQGCDRSHVVVLVLHERLQVRLEGVPGRVEGRRITRFADPTQAVARVDCDLTQSEKADQVDLFHFLLAT